MSSAHKRYMAEQLVGGIVVNFVLNAIIGWVVFRTMDPTPFWGMTSILGDTLAMGFLLPFFVCLFVTLDTRRKMKAGRFPAIPISDATHPVVKQLPMHLLKRSILLGLMGWVFVIPLLAGMHFLLESGAMPLWDFVWFKGMLAALMAAPITLVVVKRGFSDMPAPGQ